MASRTRAPPQGDVVVDLRYVLDTQLGVGPGLAPPGAVPTTLPGQL